MEVIVANVDHIKFDIDYALEEQFGALPLPFPGMDKSTAAVCEFYTQQGDCSNGPQCPYRHVRGDRTVVCKHWLRGLCKKGDQCEFLHEYDMTKMPECYFYARFNACHNKECPFLHIDPESKIKDCPWYDRGFCRHGPQCRHRHVRRVLCSNYLAGLCPEGKACKFMHPRFELPAPPDQKDLQKRTLPVCHYCSGVGHKASNCHKMPPDQREAAQRQEEQRLRSLGIVRPATEVEGGGSGPPTPAAPAANVPRMRLVHKPLDEVTCFKCGNKGHYANKCPKGHLAFLSSQAGNHQNPPPHHNNFNNNYNQNQQFNNNHHQNQNQQNQNQQNQNQQHQNQQHQNQQHHNQQHQNQQHQFRKPS